MGVKQQPLKPRKAPIQKRSASTLLAIHQATIQVLLNEGLNRTTTTRIAERAGVSIGSLYQYYPNKQALFLALINSHLGRVAQRMREACELSMGKPLNLMVRQVVSAYINSKMENPSESRVLYDISLPFQKDLVAVRAVNDVLPAMEAMLISCSDKQYDNPRETAFFTVTALIGPVQIFLNSDKPPFDMKILEKNLHQLIQGYLKLA